jgi:sec-independent protein translocase protein TatB
MGIEMIFIFLLALILFGPKRLPEMAREIGKFAAEFKRASNDFKYQLQSEIEKAGNDGAPAQQPSELPAPQPPAQQTTSFMQTILPPSVKSAINGIDEAHERLMRTARMAFDAQNFTLRPPEPPPAPAAEPEPPAQPAAPEASQASSPVETFTAQPAPNPAAASSNSAPQRS